MTAFCWIVLGLGLFLQPTIAILRKFGDLTDESISRYIFELPFHEWNRIGAQVAFGSLCMIFGWLNVFAR